MVEGVCQLRLIEMAERRKITTIYLLASVFQLVLSQDILPVTTNRGNMMDASEFRHMRALSITSFPVRIMQTTTCIILSDCPTRGKLSTNFGSDSLASPG